VKPKPETAALAYIGGSVGTLIGADLLNLDKVQGLEAPVASIGGAGTTQAASDSLRRHLSNRYFGGADCNHL
jgi:uncharacterized membrane protein